MQHRLKISLILFAIALIFFTTSPAQAVGNFSAGVGAVGNIFVVDSHPELGPGVGGTVYFDYRWSPQFSTQFGFLVSTQNGTGPDSADSGKILFGMPTFDLKFFLLSSESRWDPYGLIGIGVYALAKGSDANGVSGVGVGADVGLGIDYYLTEHLSAGFSGIYRSIGLIDSISGNSNNGTGLFPFSLTGNVAWHW